MRRNTAVAAAVVAGVLGLASCGSSSTSSSSTTLSAATPDECIEDLNVAKTNVIALNDQAQQAIIAEKSATGSAVKIRGLVDAARERLDNAAATCEAACPGAADPVVQWLDEYALSVGGIADTLLGNEDTHPVPAGDLPSSIACV